MTTPMLCVGRPARLWAEAFGWKFRSRISLRMRLRVSAPTPGASLSTLDTVPVETWAIAAMFLIVSCLPRPSAPRLLARTGFSFPYHDELVRANVPEHVDRPARPLEPQLVDQRVPAEAEVDARV